MKLTKLKLKQIIKEEFVKEDIGLENQWEELSDLLAEIMNHSSDHEAALKAERAFELLEEMDKKHPLGETNENYKTKTKTNY